MKASGGLLALLVAFWALVLLPMWVRRHQDALAERSAENFSRAMRVLARRVEGETGVGEQATPHVSDPSPEREQALAELALPAGRAARARARVRRTRVLTVLLLLVLAATVVAATTSASGVVVLAPLVLLGGYVVALRASARRDARTRDSFGARPPHTPLPVVDLRDAPAVRPEPARTVLFDAESLEGASAVIDLRDDADAHWDPRETPLPTYVRKNALHRRRITLGRSEPWTAHADEARPEAKPVADAPPAQAGPGGPDPSVERRRAVND